jgi:glycosyltransferase involved in cell wall biosynthesis
MALELGSGLRAAGHDVTFVVSSWHNDDFQNRLSASSYEARQMPIGFISATANFDSLRMTAEQLLYVPSLWAAYNRFIREISPNHIVHTNWHHLLLLLPFLKPKRDLFWVHEIIPIKRRFLKLFSILDQRLSCFVAVSNAVAWSLLKLGVSIDHIVVVHNGVVSFQSAISERTNGAHNIRIGIVGQIAQAKGHEDAIQAIYSLSQLNPKIELHIFGTGKSQYRDKLQELVGSLGLSPQVKWHGFVSERADIYSKIDICVVPSRFDDPLPTVAIEAAMAGLPCVAYARGGLPEIIENGVTGLLVDSGNVSELAVALEMLLKDPVLRMRMGMAAQHLAQERFAAQRFHHSFAALLETC